MKLSYLFLADGFEEIEALTCVDLLRRADIPVKTVSITNALQVTGAHGVTVNADLTYNDTTFDEAEWLILPGGMPGAANLYGFAPLCSLLKKHAAEEGKIAAICAAPAVVLGQLGLLNGKPATCYPGFEKYLENSDFTGEPVVSDGQFVLANGPANAMLWALAIIAATINQDASERIGSDLLFYPVRNEDTDFRFG